MKQNISEDFKKEFLRKFTEELVRNYSGSAIVRLNVLTQKEEETEKQKIDDKIDQIDKERAEMKNSIIPRIKIPAIRPFHSQIPRKLKVPDLRIPESLKYLKPKMQKIEITLDLSKLNSLIKNPEIKIIECNGPDKNLIVHTSDSEKEINIELSKEEIHDIINKFAEKAKMPISQGVFKARVGTLQLYSIISEAAETKFIIEKIS
ncbi:MAG: hypothetical protein Q7S56_02830 [Nanoarchaeota archaeon]|nr:hypothetical protein [Nanoarchaeota archaeon]